MHYYQFSIGDYRRRTGYLTPLEHGVYRSLLDTYYLEEQPLCADDAVLMRTHNIRTGEEGAAFKNVITDFFELCDDGYHHQHCDEEIAKYRDKSAKASASAKARWNKDANALRTDSEGNANHKPITTNQEPKKSKRFAPPSLDEVRDYFVKRGEASMPARSEAEKFVDFYTSKGWMVGKTKMKDWKASVRNWMKRSNGSGTNNQSSKETRREHSARIGSDLKNRVAARVGGEVISPSESDISPEVG